MTSYCNACTCIVCNKLVHVQYSRSTYRSTASPLLYLQVLAVLSRKMSLCDVMLASLLLVNLAWVTCESSDVVDNHDNENNLVAYLQEMYLKDLIANNHNSDTFGK